MANGAIKERLDYEMGRVINNISDPNTKPTAKRTITVKITLEPDEERQHVEVSATAYQQKSFLFTSGVLFYSAA